VDYLRDDLNQQRTDSANLKRTLDETQKDLRSALDQYRQELEEHRKTLRMQEAALLVSEYKLIHVVLV
jgi:predicted ribosome quality control (RQC) complex YloA/Tae2 family protein